MVNKLIVNKFYLLPNRLDFVLSRGNNCPRAMQFLLPS